VPIRTSPILNGQLPVAGGQSYFSLSQASSSASIRLPGRNCTATRGGAPTFCRATTLDYNEMGC
jgi:hypothetical protein